MAGDPIEDAIRAGKVPPSRRAHYERAMAADPVGTRQLLAQLGSTVPIGELGTLVVRPYKSKLQQAVANAKPDDSYPREWLGPLSDRDNPPQAAQDDYPREWLGPDARRDPDSPPRVMRADD